MAKKKETICEKCKYFENVCKHKSNIIIQINKKIEKEVYKTTKQKAECEYFG